MAEWLVTRDRDGGVLRLVLPEHLTAVTAHDALTELAAQVNAGHRKCVMVADLRSVRRMDADAPVVGALAFAPAAAKIEHVYIVTENPALRAAASAAASSIGLRSSCHDEEPNLAALRRSGESEPP